MQSVDKKLLFLDERLRHCRQEAEDSDNVDTRLLYFELIRGYERVRARYEATPTNSVVVSDVSIVSNRDSFARGW